MSKQIYIDSNGNEIQVSGTVNTADMMPMSGNDSTKVSEAIGDLSQLTTTDKSSLVGAVNEMNTKISDTATTFTLTYPVLADLNVHGTNCWYNPLTKEVSIDIHLYSASGGIKGANQLIATIPTGKRPNSIINTYCIAVPKDSNLTDLRSEGVFISTDGTIKCNNFILGTDMKYFALQCKYYIV